MIYQCYECKKLFDEDDGAIVRDVEINPFPIPFNKTITVFKCRDCIGIKGKKIIEGIQEERKNKRK